MEPIVSARNLVFHQDARQLLLTTDCMIARLAARHTGTDGSGAFARDF
jgi:hypothetical protein